MSARRTRKSPRESSLTGDEQVPCNEDPLPAVVPERRTSSRLASKSSQSVPSIAAATGNSLSSRSRSAMSSCSLREVKKEADSLSVIGEDEVFRDDPVESVTPTPASPTRRSTRIRSQTESKNADDTRSESPARGSRTRQASIEPRSTRGSSAAREVLSTPRRSTRASSAARETTPTPKKTPRGRRGTSASRSATREVSSLDEIVEMDKDDGSTNSDVGRQLHFVSPVPAKKDSPRDSVVKSVCDGQEAFDDDEIQCVGVVVLDKAAGNTTLPSGEDDTTEVGAKPKDIAALVPESESLPVESAGKDEASEIISNEKTSVSPEGVEGTFDVAAAAADSPTLSTIPCASDESAMEWSPAPTKEWIAGQTPASVRQRCLPPTPDFGKSPSSALVTESHIRTPLAAPEFDDQEEDTPLKAVLFEEEKQDIIISSSSVSEDRGNNVEEEEIEEFDWGNLVDTTESIGEQQDDGDLIIEEKEEDSEGKTEELATVHMKTNDSSEGASTDDPSAPLLDEAERPANSLKVKTGEDDDDVVFLEQDNEEESCVSATHDCAPICDDVHEISPSSSPLTYLASSDSSTSTEKLQTDVPEEVRDGTVIPQTENAAVTTSHVVDSSAKLTDDENKIKSTSPVSSSATALEIEPDLWDSAGSSSRRASASSTSTAIELAEPDVAIPPCGENASTSRTSVSSTATAIEVFKLELEEFHAEEEINKVGDRSMPDEQEGEDAEEVVVLTEDEPLRAGSSKPGADLPIDVLETQDTPAVGETEALPKKKNSKKAKAVTSETREFPFEQPLVVTQDTGVIGEEKKKKKTEEKPVCERPMSNEESGEGAEELVLTEQEPPLEPADSPMDLLVAEVSQVVEETETLSKSKKRKITTTDTLEAVEFPTIEPPVITMEDTDSASALKKKKKKRERKQADLLTVSNEAEAPSLDDSSLLSSQPVVNVAKRDSKKFKEGRAVELCVVTQSEVHTEESEPAVLVTKKEKKSKRKQMDTSGVEECPLIESEPVEADDNKEGKKLKRKQTDELATQPKRAVLIEMTPPVHGEAQILQTEKKKQKLNAIPREETVVHSQGGGIVEQPADESVAIGEDEKPKKKKKKAHKEILREETVVESQGGVIVEQPADESVAVGDDEKPKKKKKKKAHKEEIAFGELRGNIVESSEDVSAQQPRKAKKKKAKRMVVVDVEEDALEQEVQRDSDGGRLVADVPEWKQLFNNPLEWKTRFERASALLYQWTTELKDRSDDLPKKFVSEHPETQWQMILHAGKQLYKDHKRYGYLLDEEIRLKKDYSDQNDDSSEEEAEVEDLPDDFDEVDDELDDGDVDLDEMDDEEEEGDLFNMKEEDLEDLDEKLKALDSDLDEGDWEDEEMEQGPSGENEKQEAKKYKKTVVDDAFFSLRRMEAELDESEKNEGKQENIFDTAEDDHGARTTYRYEDFFGKRADVDLEKTEKRKRKGATSEEDQNPTKKKKSVRWADGEDDEEEIEEEEEDMEEMANDEEEGEAEAGPVLLGGQQKEDESSLQKRVKKIKERISQLEQENLAPRSWELQGEVSAKGREEDALLQKHIQFDANNKKPPEITEDFTEKLESLILQRIKDRVWDDPVRTIKTTESSEPYRNERVEDREMQKQSLAEVYEKEFQEASGQAPNEEKTNPAHEDIERKMRELFANLDALCHYEFAPPAAKPELKIVSNMAALRVEEVGAMASTHEQLLAPEETKKRVKGDLKADEERTKTDKLRARRKKKNRQSVMAAKFGDKENQDDSWKKKGKKSQREDAVKKAKPDKMRTSEFMSKLNETVKAEIAGKAKKKDHDRKKLKEKIGGSSHKFVL